MVLRLFKKIIICFLALQLAFFSPFANANTSPGGWTFSAFDAVAGVVSAVKNGAKATATVAKSPVSQKIAKGIAGGVIVGAAIPLAISQISGIALTAVDWVLDPANNAIKYKDKDAPVITPGKYLIGCTTANCKIEQAIYIVPYQSSITWDNVCQGLSDKLGRGSARARQPQCLTPTDSLIGWVYYVDKTNIDPYKSIPISTVSDKIYDNAKTFLSRLCGGE